MYIDGVQNGNTMTITTWSQPAGPGRNPYAHNLVDDDFVWVVGGHESVNNMMFRIEKVDDYTFTLRDWEHPTPPEEPGQVIAFSDADAKKMWRISGAAGDPIKITVVGHNFLNNDTVEISHVEGNTWANGVFLVADPTGNIFYLNDGFDGPASNGEYVEDTGWAIVTPLE